MFGKKKRTFCGKDHHGIEDALTMLHEIRDDVLLGDEEREAMETAIQCTAEIACRIQDGKKIWWD